VNPLAAFIGLCTPALMRLAGYSTHVTLHHLMETVSLADSGVKYPRLYRAAGWIATRLLLMANSVTVLLPAYRRTLVSKYRGKNVHLRAHGIFAATPQFPDFSLRGNPPAVLAFGKWGTYKRLEILIEAFEEVRKRIPEAKLVIAGENHPLTPGFVESVAARCRGTGNIEVTGYVPEESLPSLFRSANLLVMPYTSAGGSSGVAHQPPNSRVRTSRPRAIA
jgi:glycosyltransferase involved in cell wall biosynthesis